ncbi:hypothetical protein ICG_00924 [Bacillus cereus BAG1X1-3]|nr:hypothetical protein ICG_00924 [Bacillus cereus BAG1X1-3]EOO71647.1 hypothetical protein IC7_03930 [Bacillus cereus BAG1O-1]EOP50155.1 hypothetical protein IKQ_04193 [Bacillus cereus VDM053]SEB15424.1 hypothetical protein SAMN04488146_11180 [Bacillus nitratireducens]
MSHDTFESLLIEKSKAVFGFQGSYADRKASTS